MAKIKINKDKCKGCKLCIIFCPLKEIEISTDINKKGVSYAVFKNQNKCTGCCICAKMCPDMAIEVYKDSS